MAIVTYFRGDTTAIVSANTSIGNEEKPVGGDVTIHAGSSELVTADAAGAAIGSNAGVGGTVDVIVTKLTTEAYTNDNVSIYADGDIAIEAIDSYDLVAAVATVAVGGTAGVGVTALVSVSYAEIKAAIGANNEIHGKNVYVTASDNRDLVTADASVAVGGTAGVGATVTVIVSGTRMSQDAHDTIYGTKTIEGTTYKVYDFKPDENNNDKRFTLYEYNDEYYWYKKTVKYKTSDSDDASVIDLIEINGVYYREQDGELKKYTGVKKRRIQSSKSEFVKFTYEVDETKLSGTGMDPLAQIKGAFDQSNGTSDQKKGVAKDYWTDDDSDQMEEMLKGDGQHPGDKDYGDYGQGGTKTDDGYKTNEFDSTADGNGVTFTESTIEGLHDSVSAVIGSGSNVTAANDIKVTANDVPNQLAISGTVAAGGTAGIGVGVTVAILHTNVNALVGSNANLTAGNEILVEATSGTKGYDKDNAIAKLLSIDSDNNPLLQNKDSDDNIIKAADAKGEEDGKNPENDEEDTTDDDDTENPDTQDPETTDPVTTDPDTEDPETEESVEKSTIRLISITAAGGTVGVGVSASILMVYSEVNAILYGNVLGAKDVNVRAGMDFGKVLTVNTSVAGGSVGVNVSAALTFFNGKSNALIDGNSAVSGVRNTINVTNSAVTNATVAAAALAGGQVAVNAGVALSSNTTTVRTGIGKNVVINSPAAAVTVAHDAKSNSEAFIFSVAIGEVAVGATASVALNKLSAIAYVGVSPDDKRPAKGTGSITARSLSISGTGEAETNTLGIGVSAGAVAVNATVAVSLGYAENIASLKMMPVTLTEDLDITAVLTGETETITTSIAAGAVAAGASVAVAQIGSKNEALADISGTKIKAANFNMDAGTADTPNNTQATVLGITGSVGAVAANFNIGLAFNKGTNRAVLSGTSGTIDLTGKDGLNVRANGSGRAYSALYSAAGGAAVVNVSVAEARLTNVQEAIVDLNGKITITGTIPGTTKKAGVNVISIQNAEKSGRTGYTFKKKDPDDDDKDVADTITFGDTMAKSYLFTCGVGAVTVNASVALSVSDSTNRAKLAVRDMTSGDVIITSGGTSSAEVSIDKTGGAAVSIAVLDGYAYAKGTFEALAEAKTGGKLETGQFILNNVYQSTANTIVSPANGGAAAVDGIAVGVNISYAETSTTANTGISGSGMIDAAGNVEANTTGTVDTTATVKSPKVVLDLAYINTNDVRTKSAVKQTATIKDVSIDAGLIKAVSTLLNTSNASTGPTGGEDASGVELNLIGVKVNVADAASSTTNTAYIDGGVHNAAGVQVTATTGSTVSAWTIDPVSVSLVSVGTVSTSTWSTDNVTSYIRNADITSGGDVTVEAIANTTASSIAKKATAVNVVGVDVISAEAKIGMDEDNPQTVSAGIDGGSISTTTGDVNVTATNTGNATADAYKDVSISVVGVTHVSLPTNSWYSTEAYIKGGAEIDSAGTVGVSIEDLLTAESIANASSIGLLLNANITKGSNHVKEDSSIDIDADIIAVDGIDIHIDNSADVTAKTICHGGGFIDGEAAYAENFIDRTGAITIAEGSSLKTNFGDISIVSTIGDGDDITTYADVDSGGFVSIGDSETKFHNSVDSTVTVKGGVEMMNRFGTITIRSDASMDDTDVHASSDCSGVDVEPHAKNVGESTLTSTVTVGESGKAKTVIEGRNVYITSNIGKLDLDIYVYAKGSALLSTSAIKATNEITTTIDAVTDVRNVDITGHDNATIYASTEPAYKPQNINGYAHVQLNALSGGKASSKLTDTEAKQKPS